MGIDCREGYAIGFEDGKAAGRKEIIDMFNNVKIEPQPLMVANDIPTLRDKCAIGAISGLVQIIGLHEDVIAETAYSIADEMLKARKADYSLMLEERNKRG